MRIRTIKPEFFTHEGLFELEHETAMPIRVAFAGLWSAADREGRFKWEPRRLGVAILPYDGCEFSRVLDAFVTRAFIVKYRVNDVWYGWIPSFHRHQIVNNRERASDLPECPTELNPDATTTRDARDDHALKEEGNRKGREQEGKGTGREQESNAFPISKHSRPSLEEARLASQNLMVSQSEAERWWHTREGSDWMKGTAGGGSMPVGRTWQSDLKTFTETMRESERREQNRNNGRRSSQQSEADRDRARTGLDSNEVGRHLKKL